MAREEKCRRSGNSKIQSSLRSKLEVKGKSLVRERRTRTLPERTTPKSTAHLCQRFVHNLAEDDWKELESKKKNLEKMGIEPTASRSRLSLNL